MTPNTNLMLDALLKLAREHGDAYVFTDLPKCVDDAPQHDWVRGNSSIVCTRCKYQFNVSTT